MATLRLVPPSGPTIEVTREQCLVGRDPTCEVVLADGSVSRKHARIERRGADWAVIDQGSANGTFVDSQRVAEVVLRSGQELRFGALSYRVEIEGAASTADTVGFSAPEATVVATPPPLPPRPAAPTPAPRPSEPLRASPPPPLPGAAAARERFRAAPPPAAPVPQMSAPPPPRKGRSPVFWIATGCSGCLVLVVAFVGLIVGGVYFATQAPAAAVRRHLEDLKAGKVDAVYEATSESFKAARDLRAFKRMVSRHPGLNAYADSTFLQRSVDNDVATLSGTLTSTSGAKEAVTFRLVKEGGSWRIADIRFTGVEEGSEEEPSRESSGPVASRRRAMETETLELRKDATDRGARVTIKTRTRGFALRPEGDAHRIDLVGDLETTGPGGVAIPGLSRPGFFTLDDTTPQAEGAYADFRTDLDFNDPPPGRYVVRITIRDRVGGGRHTHRVSFDLP
jgi:hypothetical protein